jgi:predicted Zn-dependent peptidase
MRSNALGLLLLGLAAPAAAQPIDWSQPPPLGPEPTYTPPAPGVLALANGIPVWVVERRELPLVTVRLSLRRAGSTSDPAGKAGLAGYTADLLDEGAGGLGAVELAARLERLGTTLRTWAEEDAAYVEIGCLARNLQPSLALMAKVVTAPAFDAKEAARVREDRLIAVALRRDEPGAVAHLILEGALLGPQSPYGHPALGYAGELEQVTVDDAREFHARHYDASSSALLVAGDVDAAAVMKMLDAELGAWRGAPPGADLSGGAPVRRGRLYVVDRGGAPQSHVLLGGVGIARSDPRAFALEVVANALGGTFSSRLIHRLREELGYTYDARLVGAYHRGTGLVVVDTSVVTPRTAAAIREIVRILADVRQRGLTADELKAAQQNLMRSLPQAFESVDGIAALYSDLAVTGLPPDWPAKYAARIAAVTGAEARAVARSLLDDKLLRLVVVGDMATVGRSLGELGFGRATTMDPDGVPVGKVKP